jgi:hypothetical protein
MRRKRERYRDKGTIQIQKHVIEEELHSSVESTLSVSLSRRRCEQQSEIAFAKEGRNI